MVGSTDMWSTSVVGHLMKVVILIGFTVPCSIGDSRPQARPYPQQHKPTVLHTE